jgi:hypothetical protein
LGSGTRASTAVFFFFPQPRLYPYSVGCVVEWLTPYGGAMGWSPFKTSGRLFDNLGEIPDEGGRGPEPSSIPPIAVRVVGHDAVGRTLPQTDREGRLRGRHGMQDGAEGVTACRMEPAASTISRDIAEGSSLRPSCEFPSPHSSPVAASLRLRSCARRRRSWKEGEERG